MYHEDCIILRVKILLWFGLKLIERLKFFLCIFLQKSAISPIRYCQVKECSTFVFEGKNLFARGAVQIFRKTR